MVYATILKLTEKLARGIIIYVFSAIQSIEEAFIGHLCQFSHMGSNPFF